MDALDELKLKKRIDDIEYSIITAALDGLYGTAMHAADQLNQLRLDLAQAQRHADRWRAYGERTHNALVAAQATVELFHKSNSHLRAVIDQMEKVLIAVRDKPENRSRNASDVAAVLDSLDGNKCLDPIAVHPAPAESEPKIIHSVKEEDYREVIDRVHDLLVGANFRTARKLLDDFIHDHIKENESK
jgi:hypothetical protein